MHVSMSWKERHVLRRTLSKCFNSKRLTTRKPKSSIKFGGKICGSGHQFDPGLPTKLPAPLFSGLQAGLEGLADAMFVQRRNTGSSGPAGAGDGTAMISRFTV